MGTDVWLTVAKHPCAGARQAIPGSTEILYLVAHVVHPTRGM